jgi:peroxiredoxin
MNDIEKIEDTITIYGREWKLEFAKDKIYYCSEFDRYANIIEGEIITVGSLENVKNESVEQ